ncbi:hypothetical protein P7K49_039314, partial [Saguinus oedipus]
HGTTMAPEVHLPQLAPTPDLPNRKGKNPQETSMSLTYMRFSRELRTTPCLPSPPIIQHPHTENPSSLLSLMRSENLAALFSCRETNLTGETKLQVLLSRTNSLWVTGPSGCWHLAFERL